jgi:5-methylcytosine-specific restriction endonuclease McrA
MLCGRSKRKHGVVIHVDHIKPKSKYPELALEYNNLQLLCEDCNLGKSNKYETDYRPEEA